ncbi:DUF5937 family protein [Bacillus sp. FJAT-49736]|uniref:ArsR/SmtB family transcription factor n=1 Tax=Bacillus sp. FJAT-49736 TaxID=2833582 RepID=UPI001BCA3EFC|nr:DUF5937 family protein [Bacillus sp. FJAT-49736]MBS4172670.1 winged helix-turn-helix transcriptional regulator [Bacillus sp. FJAT-49736]
MSFTLRFSNFSAEQIAFGYSAAHETLLALHVFVDCKHHPLHIPWVLNARKKVHTALKEEIESFSILYKRPIVTFWDNHSNTTFTTFERELDLLAQKPIEFYSSTVMGIILNDRAADEMNIHQVEQKFSDIALKRYPESGQVITELLNNPEKNRARFIRMLEDFWKVCLEEEWPRIEELFVNDISLRGTTLLKEGPLQLLSSLSPEIAVYPSENKAVIRRVSKDYIFIDEQEELFLTPSYFAWPHLFVKRDKPIGINYSIMENQLEAAKPIPPEELIKFLRAIGDFTRLQIVKYLADRPRSTRELAGLIGVTEGAISKHLKQLGEAGLITAKRDSYYVFYQLIEQPLKDFPNGLSKFLLKN